MRTPTLMLALTCGAALLGGACGDDDVKYPGEPVVDPYMVAGAETEAPRRGYIVKMGHAHAHTAYSHDGCDDQGFVDGVRNEECVQQFRDELCETAQDFMFITDHSDNYADFEYPEVLLYDQAAGDELITRDGTPVANWMTCSDGRRVLMTAGVDKHLLALGLEGHAAPDPQSRRDLYGSKTIEVVDRLKAQGAIVVSGYSDEWDPDLLYTLPLDGFELYNPVTNLRTNMEPIIQGLLDMLFEPEKVPVPELAMILAFEENQENLHRWATLLEMRPVFNYVGTNAHRNTFAEDAGDGERLDSYRRLWHWFSNYVLIPGDVTIDDRVYKEAFLAGRLWHTFNFLGYATGFDFYAEENGAPYEMGSHFDGASAVDLVITLPRVYGNLPKGAAEPEIYARVLKAHNGDWQELVTSDVDFTYTVQPGEAGVYRVDVRIVPHHLRQWLGTEGDGLVQEYVWVYSNPMFIGMSYPEE